MGFLEKVENFSCLIIIVFMKRCYCCGLEKPQSEFYKDKSKNSGLHSSCKKCNNLARAARHRKRLESEPEFKKQYYLLRRAKLRKKIERDPEYRKKLNLSRKERHRRRVESDPEYRKKYNNKQYLKGKRRLERDPIFRYRKMMSATMREGIKEGYNDGTLVHRVLGVDFNTMRSHIQSLFIEGMSWDNFGEWHLDHIIPLSIAKTEEEVLKLLHYTNVQPLWAKDNLKKSNKIPEGYQIPF